MVMQSCWHKDLSIRGFGSGQTLTADLLEPLLVSRRGAKRVSAHQLLSPYLTRLPIFRVITLGHVLMLAAFTAAKSRSRTNPPERTVPISDRELWAFPSIAVHQGLRDMKGELPIGRLQTRARRQLRSA